MNYMRFGIAWFAVIAAVAVLAGAVGATTTRHPQAVANHLTSACTAADLRPKLAARRPGTGGTVYAIGLTNVSSSPCHTISWPTVRFFDAHSTQLGGDATRT